MDVDDLITDLDAAGVTLWLERDELRFRAPKGVFTEDRRAAVRAHRAAIVERLRQAEDVRLSPDSAGRHEPFPLTDLQAAYLVGRGPHYEYGGVACHAYVEYEYPDLDPRRVQSTWDRMVARHDMLRAVVHPDGYQVVLADPPEHPIPVTDLRGQDAALDGHLRAVRDRMSHRVARTDRWPLFALHLTRADRGAVLHLSLDLLIVDYASVQLLMSEFDRCYADPTSEPATPEISFRDYVIGRRRVTETARYARDRDYWLGRLDDLPPAPDLPVTGTGEVTGPVRFRRLEHVLDAPTWAGLRDRAARRQVTASAALLTAYAEVIGRWSRSPRFTLTVPTFQRLPLHPDVDRLVGDFTVVEPLAVDLAEPEPFQARTAGLSARLLEDLSHGLFTGGEVLGELARRTGARPLLPVVFTSTLDAPADDPDGPDLGTVGYAISQTPQVWIDCQVMPRAGGLALSWDVREDVLPDGLADDAFAAWTDLVGRLAAGDRDWDVPGPVQLPAAQLERRRRANDTAGPLPDGLLHEEVVAQARRTPERIAVVAGDVRLTYGELLRRAGAVADHLRAGGLRPAEPVAVFMDKGWEQVVAVLGVLCAGGAYLPVDTAQPPARRDAILTDAGVRTVLTQSWLAGGVRRLVGVTHLTVDSLAPADALDVPASGAAPDDLAYVIYTSGSTGSPKGVMISHRAARNTVDDVNRRFAVGPDDAVLGLAGLGFDLSVYDIFGLLAVGGRLVLPDADRRGDPSHWADLVGRHAVTVWNSVPGQLQMLHDYLRAVPSVRPDALRLAMLSGDWIPVTLPDAIRALLPALRVVSLGGATEGAIWSIWHPIDRVDPHRPSIPYGTPLTNQSFHVLDDRMRDRPDWTAGELYIGGAGVALGYHRDPERSAARFPSHPMTGERLYRTGDLGRYRPDGTIEFLGREDDQVKIRGYRIELAEVESAVQLHPGVAHAAVLVDADHPAGKRLAAFVEPAVVETDPIAAAEAGEVGAAAAAVSRAAQAGVDRPALATFQQALADVGYAVMTRTLRDAGLFTDGRAYRAEEVSEALSATATTRPVVRRWLAALARAGHLRADPGTGVYHGPLSLPADRIEEAWRRLAEAEARVAYSTDLIEAVRTCAERLPELIAGTVDVRALLFPGARADAMAAAYRDNLAVAHLNEAAAAALRALAERHGGDEPLRIVEVGGGVAGTTAALAPALAEFTPDYLFTDPSTFFLAEAREQFAHHPWIRYARLDLREDLTAQGLAPNSADVVICPNHLHTAPDTAVALDRLRGLLAPGGWLLVMEQTRDDDPALLVSMEFLEATAGPFVDARADGGQSFLTEAQWRELLGTALVGVLPEPGEPLHPTGQQLFLARVKTDRAVLTPAALARHAGTRVPEYMVPSVWQLVDALPVTGNGKVDRKRLRSLLPSAGAGEQAAAVASEPADALERQIAALWAELLDRQYVGRHDDFFDLGGDSLLVARLVGLLRERVPDVVALEWEVVLRHMLRRPTVAALAAYLRGATATGAGPEDEAPVRTSPVVRLHGSGGDPVTVLVHAGTGTIMPYRALITEIRRRSAGTGTVVGLEVPHLPHYLDADPEGLIETIAADYVRALLDLGAGEFHLVGYCLGGLIATEVARGLAEAGANVATLTAISSHSPRFRLDDEILSEYSFSVMMGIAPADLGFPADELAVARAGDAVLAASPGVMRDGGFAALTGEHAGVAEAFRSLAEVPREQRVARMCEAVPASAGMYEPDHMMRLFRTFRQSVFAITRYDPEPYAGDITFLRHSGAYPFPGSRDAVTQHWSDLCLGDLRVIDVPGDHFSCVDVAHAPGVVKLLTEITGGAVTR
ncbi:amino acid adenylation domain-containing protein [Micromonospora sp. WMMD961]|uniref:non-ribosomal peptide synthetase n=1 Tax=Micromonospora sp. WMMD961 TaxID=3016100 RepID=UPI0024170090|nr:non-ribosomal peptide synthetase [Micromonospora sp. WMMD961]MDG4782317.1 amino acid adenylation domain-containing protein [Micromonospora sp. WMMD961]